MDEINFKAIQISDMDVEQKRSFYWSLKKKCIHYLISQYVNDATKVLDIGCGTGFIVAGSRINPHNYLGLDAFPEAYNFLRKNF